MKSQKTTKRLATLSAAFLVGSVATFAADVRACSQDSAAPTEETTRENGDATPAVERVRELGGTLERDAAGRVVSLELKTENATAADVKLFVETFGDLKTVVLTGRCDDETLLSLKDCRNLRSLAVCSSSSFGKTLEALASAPELREELDLSRSLLLCADLAPLANFPKLEKLSLASVVFRDWFPDDENFRDPLEYVAECKSLKSIDLRRTQNVAAQGIEALATAPNLEEFYAPSFFGDADAERLASSKSLKRVCCEGTPISRKGFEALLAAPSFREATFLDCNDLRPNFADVAEGKLERLILQGVPVDGAGLAGLERVGAQTLRTLEISGPHLIDEASLNNALSRLRTPTALTLDLTPAVGDETIETLVAALPELESLSLRGTPITDAALDEIAKLESLDSLDVSYCGKTSPGKVAALRDSRSWREFNGKEIKRTTE